MADVLILGGYGEFGARISTRLAEAGLSIVIAGRTTERAAALAQQLLTMSTECRVETAILDVDQDISAALARHQPTVVIDTCGPFQFRDYAVARACIHAGIHYIDLADARDYVAGITTLDDSALAANVLVVAGASSVPGLSSAVVEEFAGDFSRIDSMTYGISAAQRASGGQSTAQSIASYVGKRLAPCAGYDRRYGWQGIYRQSYPGIGARWMADCDVPDLDLFPERYGIRSIRFSAGADNSLSHFGIWMIGWAIRLGVPLDLSCHGAFLSAAYQAMRPFGTETSAMHLALRGLDRAGGARARNWYVIARHGHGPNIPCVPAILLTKRLVRNTLVTRGAMPCVGLISLSDYLDELSAFDITTVTDESIA